MLLGVLLPDETRFTIGSIFNSTDDVFPFDFAHQPTVTFSEDVKRQFKPINQEIIFQSHVAFYPLIFFSSMRSGTYFTTVL